MNMNNKNAEDLLTDESFLAWYFKKNPADMALWEKRINSDPEQKKLAKEAATLLQHMVIKEKPLSDAEIGNAEKRLFNSIKTSPATPIVQLNRKRVWLRWAAAAIFLIALGIGTYSYFNSGKPEIATAYAEIRKESLPDGSEVTLNANSNITYGKNWEDGNDREVWINGEAFFQVKKTLQKSKFVVHTSQFDVIVTGTEFNVVNRNEKTNVLLKEGSVTIRLADGTETAMIPGDFVEFDNNQLQKKTGRDKQVLAWKERKFIFEKTPMKQVVSDMKDVFGVNARFRDDAVATDSLSAIIPNDNLDVFLQSLETAKGYEIIKSDNEILIRSKH